MPQNKDAGKHLSSLKQLSNKDSDTKNEAQDEKEKIVGFIRFLARKAETNEDKELIRSIKEDIEDEKYKKESYRR